MCLTAKKSSPVLLTISDSIAIQVLDNDTILRGIGNELHLHNTKKNTQIHLNIRLKGKIHGIEKDDDPKNRTLLVFGEKEFILLEWNDEYEFCECYRANLSDWISAAKFLDNGAGFVILSAHSVLLHLKYISSKDVKEKCVVVEQISCTDKSTLYCAKIYGTNFKNMTIFGGNAFGELLIWQPIQRTIENGKIRSPLLQRNAAHNGVIFSIDYEPKENLLTTTSDDRSVCFWRFNNQNESKKGDIKAIASGYGHQARVFQGKIIRYGETTYVLTIGEDSHFCVWLPNGELIYKKRAQFGAVIWNLAYAESTHTVYTVGSTGNLVTFNLRNILDEKQNLIPMKLSPANPINEAEYLSKIKFLNQWLLIGVTNCNRLVINNLKFDRWEEVKTFAGFKCTVLEVYGNLVALCGYKRFTLLEHKEGMLFEIYDGEILSGVIRSFFFLNATKYLLSDERGNCILLKKERMHEEKHSIELPKCKERWLTAALLITSDHLLLSNRLGNVMLYQYNEKSSKFDLKDILKHPHGFLGATLLNLIELDGSLAYVKSAGHDGTLKTLCINLKMSTVSVTSRHSIPVAWIETSVKINSSEVFLGFNDNHFVVWTERDDIMLQVPCGGGHRCWHFYIYEDESKSSSPCAKLVFIKNKNVLLYDMPIFSQFPYYINTTHRNYWHTRPCNVLEVINQRGNNDFSTVVSAGDDNLIKIGSFNFRKSLSALYQKVEIHSHISNIRALKIVQTSENDCIIFSGGGRAQLCVHLINLNNFRVTELLRYTIKASTTDSQVAQTHSIDPETRIMSVDVTTNATNSNAEKIYLACSDGYLRKLHFNSDNQYNVRLEREIFYGKCLLQVKLVGNLYLLTAATDGVVCFHNLALTSIYMKLPLHASGINAFDINYEPDTKELHLLTGGDDQAVSYAKICIKDLQNPLLLKKLHLQQLHTAQVTAARFSKCGRYAFTSGVDQNLIQFDLEQEEIVRILHLCVADTKGLTLDSANDLCFLYGCGLQIIKTSK